MENTREIVLDGLLTFEKELCFSNSLIADILDKYDYLEGRDKAFIKRLFEGCIERRIELDYHIGNVSSVKINKMKPLIRNLLRMGTYQILYMDSVPDSAAINEAVSLAKKRGFKSLSGFVNANLRNISRGKGSIKWPEENSVEYLSVRYSVPEWICSMWVSRFGTEETKELLSSLLEVHPVSVRLRRDLSDTDKKALLEEIAQTGSVLTQDARLDYCFFAKHIEGVSSLPGYDKGLLTVQDISSCLAIEAAGIKKGDFVYDVCASPGGKSILASEITGDTGKVISCDVSDMKAEKIKENISRMGRDNITVRVWDGSVRDEDMEEKADVLILDVPCSGLGILGKKRDIKYNASPEGLKSLTDLQWKIVEASHVYVKRGGRLIYSTCTINQDENEKQVDRICKELSFKKVTEPVQLLPHKDGCDGFFYAVLERK